MDRFAAMRAFVEIVDRGSLTAAAEALDKSQPAIVRTLAALESHLGARLLRRTTRSMSLTPEGRDYLTRCRRILADVDDAERAVGPDEGEPRGELRMTAPVQFGHLHVAPTVLKFLDRYTEVRIDLQLLDRNIDLVDEGVDLALRIGHLTDSSMIAVRVGEVRRVVCANKALLDQTGLPVHPRELTDMPCIRQQNLPHATTWPFRDGSRELNVSIDGAFRCNHVAAAVLACTEGAGFGQFLSYQVQQPVGDGDLEVVLEDYEVEPVPVSLVYPGGRLVSTRLRALINWLRDALRELEALKGLPGTAAT